MMNHRFRKFLLITVCLLFVPSFSLGQGFLGGNITGSSGGPASMRSLSVGNDSFKMPGTFAAGYYYHSYGSNNGPKFNEFKLSYYLPLKISGVGVVTPYVVAHLTDVQTTLSENYGWPKDIVRLGGYWSTRLRDRSYLSVIGEYDTTRCEGQWYPGGRAALLLGQFVAGQDLATLGVNYFFGSTGDLFVAENNSSGFDVSLAYSHDLFFQGPRLRLSWTGYQLAGEARERGQFVDASAFLASGLIKIYGRFGQDSVLGANYTVGTELSLGL